MTNDASDNARDRSRLSPRLESLRRAVKLALESVESWERKGTTRTDKIDSDLRELAIAANDARVAIASERR